MNVRETALEKKSSAPLKEKGQYAVALGAIAVMLYFVGFPVFVLFFFGVIAFFIWKAFSYETRNETRRIFEFYLAANEILREDDRRWYGFEIRDSIGRGEEILKSMSVVPPLVHFGLGSLYQKIDDHSSAVKHLAYVVDETASAETAVVFPTKELREYVRILRKIERSPAEAPLTSTAVRSLERARKNKARDLLTLSRERLVNEDGLLNDQNASGVSENREEQANFGRFINDSNAQTAPESERGMTYRFADFARSKKSRKTKTEEINAQRKTISEVLHDIYDKNVQ